MTEEYSEGSEGSDSNYDSSNSSSDDLCYDLCDEDEEIEREHNINILRALALIDTFLHGTCTTKLEIAYRSIVRQGDPQEFLLIAAIMLIHADDAFIEYTIQHSIITRAYTLATYLRDSPPTAEECIRRHNIDTVNDSSDDEVDPKNNNTRDH